ncbi:uncharacterized protein LOC135225377 [Macrobrachium nipponense]|uniref:uncharacterized protein LOC135225377 n=1 Tax=Macrobrachium nipponense TaxID=159736 RepID=UPI0030C89639
MRCTDGTNAPARLTAGWTGGLKTTGTASLPVWCSEVSNSLPTHVFLVLGLYTSLHPRRSYGSFGIIVNGPFCFNTTAITTTTRATLTTANAPTPTTDALDASASATAFIMFSLLKASSFWGLEYLTQGSVFHFFLFFSYAPPTTTSSYAPSSTSSSYAPSSTSSSSYAPSSTSSSSYAPSSTSSSSYAPSSTYGPSSTSSSPSTSCCSSAYDPSSTSSSSAPFSTSSSSSSSSAPSSTSTSPYSSSSSSYVLPFVLRGDLLSIP